jgi:hypothetical protein
MHLPDQEVIATYTRLAGEIPPQFRENVEKKQEQAAKKDQAQEKKEEAEKAQEEVKQAAFRGDTAAFNAALARLAKLASDPQLPMQQQSQQGAPPPGQAAPAQDQQQQGGCHQQAQGQPPIQQQGGCHQQAQGQPVQQAPAQQQAGQGQPVQQAPAQQQQSAWYDNKDAGNPGQDVDAQIKQMIEQAAKEQKLASDPQLPMQQQAQGGQPVQQQAGQGQPVQQAPAQQQAGRQQQQQAQGAPQQVPPPAQQQQAQGVPQQVPPPAQQQAQFAPQMPMQQQAVGYEQAGQGQVVQASDDALLNQMLTPSGAIDVGAPPIAEMDIQMEAPSMDIGDVTFQPGEDEMLRQLFAGGSEAQAAQQAQQIQEGQGQQAQGQQVQANIRTAALRTVGTRPTAGVARIGGAGAPPSRGQEVNQLTSLWQSAPDVREVFGLK